MHDMCYMHHVYVSYLKHHNNSEAWSLGPVMGRGSIPWQLDQKATIFVDKEIGGFLGEFQWFMVDGWGGNLSLERNC